MLKMNNSTDLVQCILCEEYVNSEVDHTCYCLKPGCYNLVKPPRVCCEQHSQVTEMDGRLVEMIDHGAKKPVVTKTQPECRYPNCKNSANKGGIMCHIHKNYAFCKEGVCNKLIAKPDKYCARHIHQSTPSFDLLPYHGASCVYNDCRRESRQRINGKPTCELHADKFCFKHNCQAVDNLKEKQGLTLCPKHLS